MNTYLHTLLSYVENAVHPAAGKIATFKTRKRPSATGINPKATPDSLNLRDIIKKQDSFRRSPAP